MKPKKFRSNGGQKHFQWPPSRSWDVLNKYRGYRERSPERIPIQDRHFRYSWNDTKYETHTPQQTYVHVGRTYNIRRWYASYATRTSLIRRRYEKRVDNTPRIRHTYATHTIRKVRRSYMYYMVTRHKLRCEWRIRIIRYVLTAYLLRCYGVCVTYTWRIGDVTCVPRIYKCAQRSTSAYEEYELRVADYELSILTKVWKQW